MRHIAMMRNVLALVGAAILINGMAASTTPKYFEEAISRIENEYINPRSAKLPEWANTLRADAAHLCESSCTYDDLESLLFSRIDAIHDPHFYLYNPSGTAGSPIYEVGDPRRDQHFGFLVASLDNATQVIYVHPNTPAAQDFKVGDIIRRVNGNTTHLSELLAQAERTGKTVDLDFERDGKVRKSSLTSSDSYWDLQFEELPNKVLRIQLPSLKEGDDVAVHKAIADAKKQGIRGIVLDLRTNMGGEPFITINVAGAFVQKVGLVLKNRADKRIEYAFESGRVDYYNEDTSQRVTEKFDDAELWSGPVVVITSSRTFSAGENLANILQSAGRAKVIGEITLGGGGVTTNRIEVRRPTAMILPQYRHYDLTGKARPLEVKPDVLIPLNTRLAAKGVDNQLAAAIKTLESNK